MRLRQCFRADSMRFLLGGLIARKQYTLTPKMFEELGVTDLQKVAALCLRYLPPYVLSGEGLERNDLQECIALSLIRLCYINRAAMSEIIQRIEFLHRVQLLHRQQATARKKFRTTGN